MADVGHCANCCEPFKSRPDGKGYQRYSLERIIPNTDTPVRVALESCLNVKDMSSITPVKFKGRGHGKFLCTECWANIAQMHRYKSALKSFYSKTSSQSYISTKIDNDGSPWNSPPLKRPRFTSTPVLKVTSVF